MRKLLFSLLLVLPLSCAAATSPKRSVSVEDFDYSTVTTYVQAVFGTHIDLGRGINALMVRRIAQGGQLTVVERNKIQHVMREQDFATTGRVKKGSGPRTGQIRGAELTLMGDIVAFGRDDRHKGVGVGAGTWGGGVVVGGSKTSNKAVVVLAYRLVDTESSEIVAAGEARGESKRDSKSFGAALWVGGVFAGGAVDFTSMNFAETIIGEAVIDAVDKLAADLNGRAGAVGQRQVEVEALVADVTGSILTITAGSASGVAAGDRLQVFRRGKEIKDPVTGEVLDHSETPIGYLTVTQVRDRVALGTFSGSATAVVGDAARKP